MLLLAEIAGAGSGLLHSLGAALLVGRLLHARGMSRPKKVNNFRRTGIILTWLMIFVAALYNLGYVVVSLL